MHLRYRKKTSLALLRSAVVAEAKCVAIDGLVSKVPLGMAPFCCSAISAGMHRLVGSGLPLRIKFRAAILSFNGLLKCIL